MSDTRQTRLIDAKLPEFGEPTVQPVIPPATYRARMADALSRASAIGLDGLVVYGDREHSANVSYLTGYDPRFEETLLVALPGRRPTLFLGNEGWSYAELAGGDFDRVLCQTFSLPGQPRDRQKPLSTLLSEAGLQPGHRIGAVGWKSFTAEDHGSTPDWLDLPEFIAARLRDAVNTVVNAIDLFIDPAGGLRAINEVDQLASFEFAACYASEGLRGVLFGVRPGMTELEAARLMRLNGLPLAAHTMLSAGPRAVHGLPSPSARVLQVGDPFTMACAPQGALSARAGFLVADAAGLPPGIADYADKLVAPYFTAVAEWYEAVGIGTQGGALFDIIHRHLGDAFFGVGLNPGHLLHIDEWMHSPIFAGSTIPLRSGMAIQVDVIPATHSPWFTTNIEDGIALADAALRAEFAAAYPEAWARIEARRAFMAETLGIRLRPEVLPFSNIPAWLPPYLLSPNRVMARK
jgi:Xaa-Pro aminopeptidase